MENITLDYPAILKYGVTGVIAILFTLVFFLLRIQSQRDKPNEQLLKMINKFMYFSLFLVLISLISPIIDSLARSLFSPEKFTVKGTVMKSDSLSAMDITIYKQYPPTYPTPNGEIISLEVWKDHEGKFPPLTIIHPDYLYECIDLNDIEKVKVEENSLVIKKSIVLKPTPGE